MTQPSTMPRNGEVWLVNLDPTLGDEMRKLRPAVVMSRDAMGVLALRAVVPFTNWQEKFRECEWLVRIDPKAGNGIEKSSAADAFQVRSMSVRRFVRRLGQLSNGDVEHIAAGLKSVFEL